MPQRLAAFESPDGILTRKDNVMTICRTMIRYLSSLNGFFPVPDIYLKAIATYEMTILPELHRLWL